MNKKKLIYSISILATVLLLIFVWLLIAFFNNKETRTRQDGFNDVSAREAANWDEPFLKEIKVEFLDDKGYEKMNFARDPMYRVQVLERDENGNITAYRKVYSDEDVITHVYDPTGELTAGMAPE